jgi:recombination protein RecA
VATRLNAKLEKDLDRDGIKLYVVGDKENVKFPGWSCGVKSIDDALGGQIPCGRIIELSGKESSGKTTLCHHIQAGFQKAFPNKGIAFIDAEHAMDPNYAKRIGVNNDGILVLQPESGIVALNMAVALAEDKEADIGLIIIDSVAALTTKADEENNIGDVSVAEQARMMSTSMRILNSICARRGITLLLTNQQRTNIGVQYGEKSVTSAGVAIKFYASIRIKLSPLGKLKDGEEIIGIECQADVIKNKMAPPFRKAKYTITFGIGIDPVINLVDFCINNKIIKKKGAWCTFEDYKWQGVNSILEDVRKNKELKDKLESLTSNIEPEEGEKIEDPEQDAPPSEE